MNATVGRSTFLRVVAAAGAGLALGVEVAPRVAGAQSAAEFSPVAWVRMNPNGITTVVINQSEMGQSITTGLTMMVAEELDLPMASMRFVFSPTEERYYNPFWHGISTGGSKSTPTMGPLMRSAGATARAMLVSAAAQKWNVDPKTCTVSSGVVSGPSGQKAKYTELLTLAAALPVPAKAPWKTPDQFKLIGTHQPRLDLTPKTNGTAIYGMDVKVPGMKYASIEKPVQIGGKVASFDARAALKVPGVRKVVRVSSGVAVIADNTWAAFQGRKALKVTYAPGPNAGLSTATIYEKARELVKTPGVVLKNTGDANAALAAGTVISAHYETPYLAHAPMEPMNTTADVRADRVTIWSPTQGPTGAQKAAAKITGLPLSAIAVNVTYLGGGFGRRGESDFVVDAVETSKAAGVPIKLVWTREDDIRNDPYRAGTVHALAATLSPDGKIAASKHTVANQSIAARTRPESIVNGVDKAVLRGTGDLPYAIPNQLVDYHMLEHAIPVGYWRAPLANANTFASESFIDELAHAAGKDPLAFRLSMLEPDSRPRVVLERAARLAKYGTPLKPGHAHGIAMAKWDDGWVALVSEVSFKNKHLQVHKMVASVDVGMPINMEGLEQQIPSAMIYGLSAALTGKITFANGGAVQKNFTDYTVLQMADSPEFVVDIVRSTETPTGAGEIGTPCVAPAIANALFAATGKRIRQLPLNDHLA